MIIHCLDHPMYKEKLRLRSYGEPKEGQPVYLELKKKFKDTGQKRRIALEESEAYAYLNQGVVPHLSSGTQIYSEIDYLVRRKKIVPKMFIAYHRIAFCGKEEADLRITFDSAIRFRSSHISLHESGREQYLTSPDPDGGQAERKVSILAQRSSLEDEAVPFQLFQIRYVLHHAGTEADL